MTGRDPEDVLASWVAAGRTMPEFTGQLVAGVARYEPDIDLLLEEHAEQWSVARMPALDRSILRIAVFELLHRPDVPPSAAISEAVEAAAQLSTEDSKRFVNGLLGRIERDLPSERGAAP